jgi:hypothetical protein
LVQSMTLHFFLARFTLAFRFSAQPVLVRLTESPTAAGALKASAPDAKLWPTWFALLGRHLSKLLLVVGHPARRSRQTTLLPDRMPSKSVVVPRLGHINPFRPSRAGAVGAAAWPESSWRCATSEHSHRPEMCSR